MNARAQVPPYALLLLGALIATGLARGGLDSIAGRPIWVRPLVVACLVLPWTFGLAALLRLGGLRPMRDLVPVVVAFVATGCLLVLLASLTFSGPEFPFIVLQALAGSAAVIGAAALLEGRTRLAMTSAAFPVLIAAWSLGAAAVAAGGAVRVADGRDYCIARHGGPAIRGWPELRGVALYTDRTGYKSTSRWFFHAILLVEDGDKDAAFNWSPRRMRWEMLERPERLIEPVRGSCEPSPAFLRRLATL